MLIDQRTKEVLEVIDLSPKTGEEIRQMATEEWLGVLTRLWTAFDKPLDPERLALYRDMLGNVPLGLLEKAIARVVREHLYNSVPTVAEVWAAVRKELRNPHDIDQALEHWCESSWARIVYRFDAVSTETAEAP